MYFQQSFIFNDYPIDNTHSKRKTLTGGKPVPKALLVKKIDNTI
jgi:hypothetical protein